MLTKQDVKIAKKNIIKCLTEEFKGENPLFGIGYSLYHPDEYSTHDETRLTTIMDRIVEGLYMTLEDEELGENEYTNRCIK